MSNNSQETLTGFAGLGIAPSLLAALARLKILSPTPIQKQAMPAAIQGKDLMGVAQTGTGKTFAFGIPMIQRLHQLKGQGLIVLPTRELAVQVDEALHQLSQGLGLKTAVLIGGTAIYPQIKALAKNPHIIIATPGRLNDHLEQKTMRLENIKIVVLDEADRMLDMGFAPQIQKIFRHLPHNRQTMLFSATMPPAIIKLASTYMKLPIRIEVAPTGTLSERVTQEIFILPKESKIPMVEKLLSQYLGPTLIFTRTKYGAKHLSRLIREMGHAAAEMHSNRSLGQRQDALRGFKSGKYRILIATDIASRGIDVIGIELVINFDLPTQAEDYVHRIGRTARAGEGGHAISLVTPDQRGDLRDIEKLVRKNLPVSKLPDLPAARSTKTTGQNFGIEHRPQNRAHRNFGSKRPGNFASRRTHSTGRTFKRRY